MSALGPDYIFDFLKLESIHVLVYVQE